MIQFICDHCPGVSGFVPFIATEVVITVLGIWWLLLDRPSAPEFTPIKRVKINQYNHFRNR